MPCSMATGPCCQHMSFRLTNGKREREHVENIRIKEYNKICSEKFRISMNMWRMREFPFKKIWTFFHE